MFDSYVVIVKFQGSEYATNDEYVWVLKLPGNII